VKKAVGSASAVAVRIEAATFVSFVSDNCRSAIATNEAAMGIDAAAVLFLLGYNDRAAVVTDRAAVRINLAAFLLPETAEEAPYLSP
jgi:hypothetical protein